MFFDSKMNLKEEFASLEFEIKNLLIKIKEYSKSDHTKLSQEIDALLKESSKDTGVNWTSISKIISLDFKDENISVLLINFCSKILRGNMLIFHFNLHTSFISL